MYAALTAMPWWGWILLVNLACGCAAALTRVDELELSTPRRSMLLRWGVLLAIAVIGVLVYGGVRFIGWLEQRGLYRPLLHGEPRS